MRFRLDAVHSIYDASANPFLAELSNAVRTLSQQVGREIVLIAESDLKLTREWRSRLVPKRKAWACQWTVERRFSSLVARPDSTAGKRSAGYYGDFGTIHHLAKTISNGWDFDGIYAVHRERRHGNSPLKLEPEQFVVCIQNHDQVGNAALQRSWQLVS